jgi:small conductance mechanosensitive channel
MGIWSDQAEGFVNTWGANVLYGLAVLVLGWILARWLGRLARGLMRRSGVEPTVAGFTANLLYVGLMTVVAIAALHRFGFPAVSFVGVIGAAGLAIGLALKDTLSDLAAGVMLIAFQPFRAGDRIEAAGTSGVVTEIHVFATTVQADDKTVIIPNGAITRGNIVRHARA